MLSLDACTEHVRRTFKNARCDLSLPSAWLRRLLDSRSLGTTCQLRPPSAVMQAVRPKQVPHVDVRGHLCRRAAMQLSCELMRAVRWR